jgi:hypothetical protein
LWRERESRRRPRGPKTQRTANIVAWQILPRKRLRKLKPPSQVCIASNGRRTADWQNRYQIRGSGRVAIDEGEMPQEKTIETLKWFHRTWNCTSSYVAAEEVVGSVDGNDVARR